MLQTARFVKRCHHWRENSSRYRQWTPLTVAILPLYAQILEQTHLTSAHTAPHYDLCPVDSCVNLLSALDSRNGVMSMRTSLHLRALLINNNPCGQQFSWSRFTAVFDAYTGTYNDLCHIICYFRKLQAPRSALVCGATCGMHVFAGFVDKFFGHFRPEIGYGARQSGSRNLYKMLPIYSSSIWQKLSTRHV